MGNLEGSPNNVRGLDLGKDKKWKGSGGSEREGN